MIPANTARIRIYVPTAEIPFAGHPGDRDGGRARRPARPRPARARDGRGADRGLGGRQLRDDAPADPHRRARSPTPRSCSRFSGSTARSCPVEVYDNGMAHIYVVLDSPEAGGGARSRSWRRSPGCRPRRETRARGSTASRDRARVEDAHVRPGADRGRGSRHRVRPPARSPVHAVRHGLVDLGTEITISQGAEIGRPSTLYARAEGDSPDAITEVAGERPRRDRRQRPVHHPGVNKRCLAPLFTGGGCTR